MDKVKKVKLEIVESALQIAKNKGWNDILANLAKHEEKDINYYKIYFLSDQDLVHYYLEQEITHYKQQLEEYHFQHQKIREKVRDAVLLLLETGFTQKDLFHHTIQYCLNPLHSLRFAKLLFKISDLIWIKLGDKSLDFNYYSKRLILSKVLAACFLYIPKDHSAHNKNTKEFLERRIEGVMKIEKLKSAFKAPENIIKRLPFIRLLFIKKYM